MRKLIVALTAVTLLAGTPALAEQCKDPKTKRFMVCPKKDAGMAASATTKDAKGKCHWVKTENGHKAGAFAPCPK